MHRLIYIAMSTVILCPTVLAHEAKPVAAKVYTIEVSLQEGHSTGSIEKGTLRILAHPTVMVTEGREAKILIGGEVAVGGEKVPHGISLILTAESRPDDRVYVTGALEVSTLGRLTDDDETVMREGTSVHFAKTVACGEKVRVPKSKSARSQRWLELRVEKLHSETHHDHGTGLHPQR